MPRTGTGKTALKGSSLEHLLIERSPGGTSPLEDAQLQPKGRDLACKGLLRASSHLMVHRNWYTRVNKGWNSHQREHSLICLGDTLLWGSTGWNGSIHNDPEKDVRLLKALNPHFPSYKFWMQARQIFNFTLRKTGKLCPLLFPGFFMSLLKHTGEVYFGKLKEEKGSCTFHFCFIWKTEVCKSCLCRVWSILPFFPNCLVFQEKGIIIFDCRSILSPVW